MSAKGRVIGRVKWFDNRKGIGFILDDQEVEHFVHYTEIRKSKRGYKSLNEGDTVTFIPGDEGRGPKALDVV